MDSFSFCSPRSLTAVNSLLTEKIQHKFSFCERKQYKNNTWINNDITCIFGWTIPLSVLLILYLLCWPDLFSHVLWVYSLSYSLLIFSAWDSFQCLMLVPKVKSCVFSTKSSTFEFLSSLEPLKASSTWRSQLPEACLHPDSGLFRLY